MAMRIADFGMRNENQKIRTSEVQRSRKQNNRKQNVRTTEDPELRTMNYDL
jgi:hypothetical protein